jgi:hypothetical protein
MPTVAGNYPEMNLSLDQKLAEAVGAATRYPSLTLQVNEANLISFTRTGVQVPALMFEEHFAPLLEENPAEKPKSQDHCATAAAYST